MQRSGLTLPRASSKRTPRSCTDFCKVEKKLPPRSLLFCSRITCVHAQVRACLLQTYQYCCKFGLFTAVTFARTWCWNNFCRITVLLTALVLGLLCACFTVDVFCINVQFVFLFIREEQIENTASTTALNKHKHKAYNVTTVASNKPGKYNNKL